MLADSKIDAKERGCLANTGTCRELYPTRRQPIQDHPANVHSAPLRSQVGIQSMKGENGGRARDGVRGRREEKKTIV